jgi:hypothetical protein
MGGGASKKIIEIDQAKYATYCDGKVNFPKIGPDNYDLVISAHETSIKSYPLKMPEEGGPIKIGRSSTSGATVKVSDENVSGLHLEINWDGLDWVATDVESTHGTKALVGSLPAEQVKPGKTFVIPGPMCFVLGRTTFVTIAPRLYPVDSLAFLVTGVSADAKPSETGPVDTVGKAFTTPKTPVQILFGNGTLDDMGRPLIAMPHPNVADKHALLRRSDCSTLGCWDVSDTKAEHGVVVGGFKLDDRAIVPLWPGAELTFGHTKDMWDGRHFTGKGVYVFKVLYKYGVEQKP